LPSRGTLLQAGLLVLIAVGAGLARNLLLPQGIAITLKRPRPAVEAQKLESEAALLSDIAIAPGSGGRERSTAPRPRLWYVTLAQVDSLRNQEGVVVVDARPAQSFAKGHIPGAMSLPADEAWQLEEKFAQLAKAHVVLVYCDDPRCDAAERLADELLAHGCMAIAIYREGIRGWAEAGRPIAREEQHQGGQR